MALFHFGKKEEEKKTAPACCCGADHKSADASPCCAAQAAGGIQQIKVLGLGCRSCRAMLEATREAVQGLGLSVEVEYVTELEKIVTYGAMSMPALVINEQVVSMGRVLKKADVEELLRRYES